MKILVVENTAEGQTILANKLAHVDPIERDVLDLEIKLGSPADFREKVSNFDVMLLGPGLGTEARNCSRVARELAPNIEIIMIVNEQEYSSGVFRLAHIERVRKVLSENCTSLDLLQELVGIYESYKTTGRFCDGKLVVVTQAKGGVGASSIAAALADCVSLHHKRSLLWDLDIESKDLTRAFAVSGAEGKTVTSWVTGGIEVSRGSLHDAVVDVTCSLSILMPPDKLAAAIDLVGHADGFAVANRIAKFARASYDAVVVDTAGRVGPACGSLMRSADSILVVVDDSMLGLTAIQSYLDSLSTFLNGAVPVRFVCSGTRLSVEELQEAVDPGLMFGRTAWSLEPIPVDPKGAVWAGTGESLYTLGRKNYAAAIEAVAEAIAVIPPRKRDIHNARLAPESPFSFLKRRVANGAV